MQPGTVTHNAGFFIAKSKRNPCTASTFAGNCNSIMRAPYLIFILIISCFACGKHEIILPEPTDVTQSDYFPLQLGKYVIYQTDSILYDIAPGGSTLRDTVSAQIKEQISDTLRDNTGALVYRIERYERRQNSDPWVFLDAFTAGRNAGQAFRNEQNWRYLKLIFPMNVHTEWDGNLWIDKQREIEFAGERMRPFSNWHYKVDSLDIPARAGAFSFDSTLLITEADDNNIFERRLSRVRYAKHIGVVWREQWILDSQYCNQAPTPTDCETIPWDLKGQKGYILRQFILEHN